MMRRTVEVFVALFGALTLLGFLGRLWWPFELLSFFRPWQAIVLVVVGLVALVLRFLPVGAAALALAALNVAAVAAATWERPDYPRPVAGTTVRLLLLNVFGENNDFDAVSDLIRSERADVVGLTELTPAMADAIAPALARYPRAGRRAADGVLRDRPVRDSQAPPAPDRDVRRGGTQRRGGRPPPRRPACDARARPSAVPDHARRRGGPVQSARRDRRRGRERGARPSGGGVRRPERAVLDRYCPPPRRRRPDRHHERLSPGGDVAVVPTRPAAPPLRQLPDPRADPRLPPDPAAPSGRTTCRCSSSSRCLVAEGGSGGGPFRDGGVSPVRMGQARFIACRPAMAKIALSAPNSSPHARCFRASFFGSFVTVLKSAQNVVSQPLQVVPC